MINLKISDQELHQTLKNKAAEERRITKEVVIYIEEVIRRKLFLKYGSSLHGYLTKHIGYSEASAQRRIDAARAFGKVPEVAPAIEDGRLKLGQIAKVEQIVRELKKSGKKIDVQKQKEVLVMIENKTSNQTDLILAQEFDVAIKAYDKRKVQKDGSVRHEMTFSKEEMEIIEEAQAILSNKTGGKLRDTFVEMARKVVKDSKPRPPAGSKLKSQSSKVEPGSKQVRVESNLNIKSESQANIKFKEFKTKSINKILTPTSAAEVHQVSGQEELFIEEKELKSVTPRLKKEIKLRDQVCQWIDPVTKQHCGSKFFLQVDHIKLKSHSGPNTPSNLRILCKNHNVYRYEQGYNEICANI